MKSYSEYRKSSIIWFEEIPTHWKYGQLKYKIENNDGGVWGKDTNKNNNIVFRSTEVTVDGKWDINEPAIRTLSDREIKKALLKSGDLLITKSSGSKKHIGKTALVTPEIEELKPCFSNFMQRIHPNSDMNSRFLYYFLNSFIAREQYNYFSTTTTGLANLNTEIIGGLRVPFPPLIEQEAIVGFLDRKISQIDTLIVKKHQQIELLKEYRTALINRVVTKGLDSNAPMKDSGYGWLGDIPRHWLLQKLKYIASVDFSNVDKHVKNNEIPVLLCNYVDVYYNNFIHQNLDFMSATASKKEISQHKLIKGDVIITKDSETWDDIAVPAYVKETMDNVICGYHLAQIRPKSIIGNFLFWVMSSSSINDQYKVEAHGITRYGLGKDAIENSLIPIPPTDEQQNISNYLNEKNEKIEKLISIIQEEILRLNDYRKSLISDVVTGKIDVSMWRED